MFGKRSANLIKRVQLKFDGKEKPLKLDWIENNTHSKEKRRTSVAEEENFSNSFKNTWEAGSL